MKRFVLRGLLALAAICGVPAMVWAQTTGQIIGTVTDQNGVPLKGVKITAKSPTQIGGPKTTYSNDEGAFRFVNLNPGDFDITASSPGLKTFSQGGVRVDPAAPSEVYPIMEVQTKEEEVTVVAKAPTISTTRAVVKETYNAEFLDALPLQNRSTQEDILANQTPGAAQTPGGGVRMRGGTSTQNVFKLDGFQLNDPGGGGMGQIVPLQNVASFEISSAGYGAENANAAGSVTSMVTKSGSNKFEFQLNAFHEDSALYLFQDNLDPKTRRWNFYSTLNAGGPIIKDRLWFFSTLEFRSNADALGASPDRTRPDPPRSSDFSFRGIPKLTWQITTRNKLQFIGIFNRDFFKNGQRDFSTAPEAQWQMQNANLFGGLTWTALLSDTLVFTTQAGIQQYQQDFGPELCRSSPDTCDNIPAFRQNLPTFYRFNNWDTHRFTTTRSVEWNNTLEWLPNNHDVKFTGRYYVANNEAKVSTPGDVIYVFNGNVPAQERRLFTNDPFVQGEGRTGWAISSAKSDLVQLSLSDTVRIAKYWTVIPGVGLIRSHASDQFGSTIIDFLTFTPHLSLAWDATHDGRTALRVSGNQYIDPGNLAVANFIGGSRVVQACDWNPVTQRFDLNCSFSGGPSGRTVGEPCGPGLSKPDGSPCKEKLTAPRTTEVTLGAEREIVEGISLGADFVYRNYANPYEDAHTNRVWNNAGTGLDPTGPYRNGRNIDVVDLETPSSAKRRYTGVTGSLRKREGRFKLNASYTWSKLEGNVVDGVSNAFLNNSGQDQYLYGYLAGDARHQIRTQGTYAATTYLSVGFIYNYTSGGPYNRYYQNLVTREFTDLRTRTGYDTNGTLNTTSDDRPLRLPDIQDLGLQARVNLKKLTRFNAEVWADALNLLGLRTTTSVDERDGPTWGQTITRLRPTRLRIGIDFRF